jgi:uncharacterized repeat protein (TIGR01451 family)
MKLERFWPSVALCLLTVIAKTTFASVAARGLEPLHECQGLNLRISGPAVARTGDLIRYRIRVSNNGNCQLSDVVMTNFLPREATLVSAHPEPGSRNGSDQESGSEPRLPVSKVEWPSLGLMPSETKSFEVRVKVKAAPGREITNSACVEHAKAGRRCEALDTLIQPISSIPSVSP